MDRTVIDNIRKYAVKLRKDPEQKVHAPLADGYRRVGLTDDAMNTASRGLELFPSYLLCREVLGRLLMRMGRLAEAREQLEKVHAIVKDNTELNRVLGKLYLQLEDEEHAKPLLESVLAKDPFDFEIRNLLTSEHKRRLADEAAKVYEKAVEEGDQDTIDLFNAKPKTRRTIDIDQILADDVGPVAPVEKRVRATDHMLDGLENVEDSIEAEADKIMATLDEHESRDRDDIYTAYRREHRDAYEGKEKDLHAAAVAAQIHMEVSLIEEALHLVRKLRKDEQSDVELGELESRLDEALRIKETELDRIESVDWVGEV